MFYATKKTTKNLKEYLTKIKTNLYTVFINTLLSTFSMILYTKFLDYKHI